MKYFVLLIVLATIGCYGHAHRFRSEENYDRLAEKRIVASTPDSPVHYGLRPAALDTVRLVVPLADLLTKAGVVQHFAPEQLARLAPVHEIAITGYVNDAVPTVRSTSITYDFAKPDTAFVVSLTLDTFTTLQVSYTLHFLTTVAYHTENIVRKDSEIAYDLVVRHMPCLRLNIDYLPMTPPDKSPLYLTPELAQFTTRTSCRAKLDASGDWQALSAPMSDDQ